MSALSVPFGVPGEVCLWSRYSFTPLADKKAKCLGCGAIRVLTVYKPWKTKFVFPRHKVPKERP